MSNIRISIKERIESVTRGLGITSLFLVLLVSGCSRNSAANYDKIQNGMAIATVNAILEDGMKVEFESGGRLIIPKGPGEMIQAKTGERYWILYFDATQKWGWVCGDSANTDRQVYIYGASKGPISKGSEIYLIEFSQDGRVIGKEKNVMR